ncbi:MAG: NAD-dependent epimerase/dehydratase family protein [Chloroflexi bacterium]|nr:NAD-dependent epimerase/dehydratase family protein [Chloroflexota bacterium]
MKVLVVGGTGPSGTPLVQELLDRGHEVTVYHSGAHEVAWSRQVDHIHGDARGTEAPQRDLAERRWDACINTWGRSRYIIQALKGGKIDKLVAVTGHGVYKNIHSRHQDQLGHPIPVPETTPPEDDPENNHFAYLINQGEQEIMQARADGHFQACIFRYPRVYGPRSGYNEWYWVKRVLDGRRRVLLPGDGLSVAQRGYGPNLAHMLTLALENPNADGHIFNAGDSRGLSLRMLTSIIAEALDHEWEMIPIPFAIAPRGNPYAFYSHTLLDMSKVRYLLGYEDLVSPEEALKLTARWLRDHPPSEDEARSMGREELFDYEEEDRIIERYQRFLAEFPPAVEKGTLGV